jgi:hypothetical protein
MRALPRRGFIASRIFFIYRSLIMDNKASGTSQRAGAGRKVAGDYVSKVEDVPKEVRDYAVNKLTPLVDGKRVNDAQGKEIMAVVSTAKENGSYYGPVVLNNDKYLVQAVGKDRLYAIVHRKEDLTLKGSTLALLDTKKQLNGTNVQIHYTGDKAQAYPYADKSRQSDATAPAKEASARVAIKPEDFMQKANEYAKAKIKNGNQREAAISSPPPPAQTRQAEPAGIER